MFFKIGVPHILVTAPILICRVVRFSIDKSARILYKHFIYFEAQLSFYITFFLPLKKLPQLLQSTVYIVDLITRVITHSCALRSKPQLPNHFWKRS